MKCAVLAILLTTFISSSISPLENVNFPFQFEDPMILPFINHVGSISKSVPGWCSWEKLTGIISVILNIKPKLCVEVGAFGGSSFLPIVLTLQYLHSGHAYAIDSWNNRDCIKYMPSDDLNKSWWSEVRLYSVKEIFLKTIIHEKLSQYCTVYEEESVNAASRFMDNSIEFLHWDCNHSYAGALREFQAYLPKVKSNGYILVSDVMWGVSNKSPIQEAVEILFETCELIDTLENGNVFLFKKLSFEERL